jgi:large subunit ribosomal protein L25
MKLKAFLREKESPRSLRQRGLVPGVIYGPKMKNILVTLSKGGLEGILKVITRSSKITLSLNEEEFDVFIKEIQYDSLTDEVIHLDLYKPRKDATLDMEVPLRIEGEPKGKRSGGVLRRLRKVVKVRAIPERMPEQITIDVSELDVGDAVHVSDLKLSDMDGIEILTPSEVALVKIIMPRREAVEAEEEVEEVEAEEVAKEETEVKEE